MVVVVMTLMLSMMTSTREVVDVVEVEVMTSVMA